MGAKLIKALAILLIIAWPLLAGAKVKEHRLDNGMRVLLAERRGHMLEHGYLINLSWLGNH